MNKKILALSIICFCTLLPLTAAQALSWTLYVNGATGQDNVFWGYTPAKPLKSISYAIAKACGTVTVEVSPGTYNENITIDKILNLSLQGAGADTTVIQGADSDLVIQVLGPNKVDISGFTIAGGRGGIGAMDSSSLTVRDCIVRDSKALGGIGVTRSSSAIIDNNQIYNNADCGVFVRNSTVCVTNCLITENSSSGIEVHANGDARIGFSYQQAAAGNIIQANCKFGVGVFGGAHAMLYGNTIELNDRDGIRVSQAVLRLAGANLIATNGGRGVMVDTNGSMFQGKGDVPLSPNHDIIRDNAMDGIFASNNSSLNIEDVSILNNSGNGIMLHLHAVLRILNSDIMDNASHGIILIRDGGLVMDEPAVSVSGNGEAGILCVGAESSFDGNISEVLDPIYCTGF